MNTVNLYSGIQKISVPFCECTEFVMHSKFRFLNIENIIDYAELRIKKIISGTYDSQNKLLMCVLLEDYMNGNVTIAFHKGVPAYISIIKD